MKECLYKGIDKSTIEHEKILADCFDTNLGDIDIIDADKHLFKINDWHGDNIKVIIYTEEDIKLIKNNMIDFLFLELTKKSIEIVDGIKVDLSDMIKSNMFEEQMSQLFEKDNLLIKSISKTLEFRFKEEFKGYFIWIM